MPCGPCKKAKIVSPGYALYPARTKVKCWWCRHCFSTGPVGIPFKRLKVENEWVFHCFGNYCSFECAASDAKYGKHSGRLQMYAGTLLVLMRKQLLGTSLQTPLDSAPHWSVLRDYGGAWSIQKFRRGCTTHTAAFNGGVVCLPFGFVTVVDCTAAPRKRKTRGS